MVNYHLGQRQPLTKNAAAFTAARSRLFEPLLSGVDDVDATAFAIELDEAIDQCEEREVRALANVGAGMKLVAHLTDQDVASANLLATKLLDAAALTVRVPTVAAGTLSFFMCHCSKPLQATNRGQRPAPRARAVRRLKEVTWNLCLRTSYVTNWNSPIYRYTQL